MFSPAHKLRLKAATIPPDCDYSPLLLRMGVSVRKTEKYVGYPGELGKPFKCSKENTNIYILASTGRSVGGETSRPALSFHEVPTSSPRFSIFRHPSPGAGPLSLLAGRRSRLVETPGIPSSRLPGVSTPFLPRLWGPAWSRSHSEQKASGGRRPARLALRPPLVRSGVPLARAAPAPLPAAGGYEWAQRKPRPTRT